MTPTLSPRARAGLSLREVFGLTPMVPALRECWKALAGEGELPPTRWGLSSLKIFKPGLSFRAWLKRRPADRRAPVYNLVNRKRLAEPRNQAYSVRVTDCEDFQGGQRTYDGHIGTDFVIPVGTPVTAVAPGRVARVRHEMDRGGLKVCIDHGEGLFSTSNHLGRALVEAGQEVARGQVIGLSGMSSVDGLLFFPWLAPHLHLNIFIDGEPVDPFAREDEVSLWREGNEPEPHEGPEDRAISRTPWSAGGVAAALDCCKDPELRARIQAFESLEERAWELVLAYNFRGALFEDFPRLTAEAHPPKPRLSLPFRKEDYRGAALPTLC